MVHKDKTREDERTSYQPDRRAFGKAILAGVLGGPAALSSVAQANKDQLQSGSKGQCMKLAFMLRPDDQDDGDDGDDPKLGGRVSPETRLVRAEGDTRPPSPKPSS